jgi:RNA polymerase sigma-70 factor (ECF subfamily)
LPESEIIDEVVNGNISAFEVLVRQYSSCLYKIGRSYNYNHQDTEDLMQETFIEAYKNLCKLRNRQYFKTWLIRIMLNQCYRARQKDTNRKYDLISNLKKNIKFTFPFNNYNDTGRKTENNELKNLIKYALELLPPNYRLVFSLRHLRGLNVTETAKILKITETNVKVRLSRSKVMLRKNIERIYSHEELLQLMGK